MTTAPGLIEQRLQIALEISGTGVWDWDLDLGDLHVSRELASIVGLAPGERVDTQQWLSWLHPDDVAEVRQAAVDHLRGTTSEFSREFRIRRADGGERWVHARGQVVRRDADGRARRVVGALVDTSQRRLAETLQRAKEVAELAARSKSRLLRSMSHRMRTPLNAVIGFAQLLRKSSVAADPYQVAEFAKHTLDAGRQLLRLVDDVLDLQRAEDGRLALKLAPVGIEELLPSLVDRVRELADQRGMRIGVTVEGHPTVLADRVHLLHALDDLVASAIRSGRADGLVRISAESGGQRDWNIVVEDNGSGLSAEQLQALFEPFEPIGGAPPADEQPGLGLLVSRALIERMGGRLTVSSQPGTGTRAVVTLARAEVQTEIDAQTAAPHREGGPDGRLLRLLRLLYVEDNRVNALLFEEAMRMLGRFDLRVAERGAEALAVVETWTPDVLVLDAHLPDRSGYELLAQLRTRAGLAEVPAFMCSADALAEDVERAHAAGFAGYWVKPIDFAQVLADLQRVAAGRIRG
jgi:PAS domain S-box-containing protein